MNSLVSRVSRKLFSPVDAASLGMFRILFGALMVWQAFHYLEHDRYIKYYLEPAFHFTYRFFPFVRPLPQKYFFALLIMMIVAGLGIMVGMCYRLCILVFLLGFSYVFLLDRAYFNNHYYAIILLSFLLLFVQAQRWASFAQWRRPKPEAVPYWNLFILKAQLFIIYFFGGIAKLNADWLRGEPMRGWLQKQASLPVVGYWLQADWAPYFFSWGGMVFDIAIGFLLWFKKTRLLAFLAILFFNLSNNALFQIGVFPFLMIGAATLFDEPDWPRKLFRLKTSFPVAEISPPSATHRRIVGSLIAAYFSLQMLIPLRHFLFPGNVSWTEEGHYFSWHMKLRDKAGRLKIYVVDPVSGTSVEKDLSQELNRLQRGKMRQRPPFIHQYVQHLKAELQKQGIAHPMIKVDSWISLNRRPYQRAIDPDVNLAGAPNPLFSAAPWILPLDEQAQPGILPPQEEEDEKKGPHQGQGPFEQESW